MMTEREKLTGFTHGVKRTEFRGKESYKTRKMLLVERFLGEDIESFLVRKYFLEDKSPRQISDEVTQITSGQVKMYESWPRRWLVTFGYALRDHSQAAVSSWKSPIREQRISRIWSSEAAVKRVAALKRQVRRGDIGQISQEAKKARMKQTLGDNPRLSLEEMIERGLTLEQISQKISYSEDTLRAWMKEFGLQAPKRRKLPGLEAKQELVSKAVSYGKMGLLAKGEVQVLLLRYTGSDCPTFRELSQRLKLPQTTLHLREQRGLVKLEKMYFTKEGGV